MTSIVPAVSDAMVLTIVVGSRIVCRQDSQLGVCGRVENVEWRRLRRGSDTGLSNYGTEFSPGRGSMSSPELAGGNKYCRAVSQG